MPDESGGRIPSWICRPIPATVLMLIALAGQLGAKQGNSGGSEAGGHQVPKHNPGTFQAPLQDANEILVVDSSTRRIYYANQASSVIDLQPQAQPQPQQQLNGQQFSAPQASGKFLVPYGATVAQDMATRRPARQSLYSAGRDSGPASSFYSLADDDGPQQGLGGAQFSASLTPPLAPTRQQRPKQAMLLQLQQQRQPDAAPGSFRAAPVAPFSASLVNARPQMGPLQQVQPPQEIFSSKAGPFAGRLEVGPSAWNVEKPMQAAVNVANEHNWAQNRSAWPSTWPGGGGGQRPTSELLVSQAPVASERPAAVKPIRVNLSSLLEPGQVLLSERGNRNSTRGTNVSLVDLNELRKLMQNLRPLTLAAGERATSVQNAFNLSSGPIKELDSDERRQQQQLEANDDEAEMISDGEQPAASSAKEGQPRAGQDHEALQSEEQQAAILNTLAALGAKLSEQRDEGDEQDEEGDGQSAGSATSDEFYRPAEARAHAAPAIPIELLVDHLMAGSRLATSGRAKIRDGGVEAALGSVATGDMEKVDDENIGADSEEEEEGDEDEDYEGDEGEPSSLPQPESPLPDGAESGRREVRVKPNGAAAMIDLNSVANRSDSRMPLGKTGAQAYLNNSEEASTAHPSAGEPNFASSIKATQVARSDRGEASGHARRRSGKKSKSKSKRKRRRRRRRRKSLDEDSGLVIGNKKLTRDELVRLIGILNKMASGKEASKEREASRRLLRLLIKIAIDNYKRSKVSGAQRGLGNVKTPNGDEHDRRFRDSLRSLLVEPELGGNSMVNGSTSRISIQLQPWRVQSNQEREKQIGGGGEAVTGREPGGSGGERPKSLVEISENLERYFDTDFFEDLADKNDTDAGPKMEPKTSGGQRRATARSAAQRAPIVYGRRALEEADEEDVDLDHVRLTKAVGAAEKWAPQKRQAPAGNRRRPVARRKRGKKLASGHSNSRRAAESSRRTSPRGRGQGGRRRKPTSNNEDEPNSERGESRGGPRGSSPQRGRRAKRGKRPSRPAHGDAKKRSESRRGGKANESEVSERRQLRRSNGPRESKSDEDQEDGAEEVPEVQEEVEEDEGGDKAAKEDEERVASRKRSQGRPRRRRGRRRRGPVEPNRDEIPAPISAARMPNSDKQQAEFKELGELDASEPTKKATGSKAAAKVSSLKAKEARSQKSSKTKAGIKVLKEKKAKPKARDEKAALVSKAKQAEPRAKPPQQQPERPPVAKLGQKPKRAVKGTVRAERVDNGQFGKVAPPSNDDESYSNEARQVCEDGKCQSELRSSHPLVNDYVENNPDKASSVKQIDWWLSEDDPGGEEARS